MSAGGGCGTSTFSGPATIVGGCFSTPMIVFSGGQALDGTDTANTRVNVWAAKLAGSGQKALTKLTLATSTAGSASEDGRSVVFLSDEALDGSGVSNTSYVSNIWVMSADGFGPRPVTKLTTSGITFSSPQFSPDGTRILYTSNRAVAGGDAPGPASNIWVIKPDGTGNTALTRLTATSADSLNPRYSPDGGKVVYESQRALGGTNAANTNNRRNIWIMDADGGSATPLTSLTAAAAANSFVPVFTPDGAKIVYQSQRALNGTDAANTNSTGNVWIMNRDGSAAGPLTSLTASGADCIAPLVRPDGTQIVYSSSRRLNGTDNADSTRNVWIMNIDGSATTALTGLATANVHSLEPKFTLDGGTVIYRSRRALDGTDALNTNLTYNLWSTSVTGTGNAALTQVTASGASVTGHALMPACQ